MTTYGSQTGTKKAFEYILHDYLELKAALSAKQAKNIRNFLTSNGCIGSSLIHIEGFSVNQQLVLLKSDDPQSIKNLVYLNPANGLMQFRSL